MAVKLSGHYVALMLQKYYSRQAALLLVVTHKITMLIMSLVEGVSAVRERFMLRQAGGR